MFNYPVPGSSYNTFGSHQHGNHQQPGAQHHQQQQQQQQQQLTQDSLQLHHQQHDRDSSEEQEDKPDVKRSKGSGRPRDKVWESFNVTSLQGPDGTAECKYCKWVTEAPKAFRMRNHVYQCEFAPEEVKLELRSLQDEKSERRRKRASMKRELGMKESTGEVEGEEEMEDVVRHPQQAQQSEERSNGKGKAQILKRDEEENSIVPDYTSPAAKPQQQQQQSMQIPAVPLQPIHRPPPSIMPNHNALATHTAHATHNNHNNHNNHTQRMQYPMMPVLRSPITCHVLDSTSGKPAPDMRVVLEKLTPDQGYLLQGQGQTDHDGRCSTLLSPANTIPTGIYKITFYTAEYFTKRGISTFYPCVEVPFKVDAESEHHHVPLLLSPYAYSTYRGS